MSLIETYKALHGRVESATGPDRELDAHLYIASGTLEETCAQIPAALREGIADAAHAELEAAKAALPNVRLVRPTPDQQSGGGNG